MGGVLPLQPFPVFLDPNQQEVHANATIVASGSQLFTGYGASEISLFINVKNAPTGTSPTLVYTIQEVDPGDGVTPIGASAVSTVVRSIGFQRITIISVFSGALRVGWEVTGVGASFTGVYATLNAKGQAVTLVDKAGTEHGTTTNPLHVQQQDSTGTVPADKTFLADEILSELRQMRRLLEILTDEAVPDEQGHEE